MGTTCRLPFSPPLLVLGVNRQHSVEAQQHRVSCRRYLSRPFWAQQLAESGGSCQVIIAQVQVAALVGWGRGEGWGGKKAEVAGLFAGQQGRRVALPQLKLLG